MSAGPIDIIDNPVLKKCARSRVRVRHMLSWGTVIGTITAFIFLAIYFVGTRQELASSAEAARVAILPLLIIQAVILMGLGTNSVAAGIAIERDSGRIDYHRMTPMSPTAKILGFLFGLPARQYFLFAVMLPFVLAAVIIGEFPLTKLALFYLVFFTSVWTYHMTGMTAGMLTKRPWQAALFSVGAVFVLYFILPNLSQLGVTFFEFLTIRPTLMGMVYQEIEAMRPGMAPAAQQFVSGLDSFRPVPFFNWDLHPITYTLIVQGALITMMFAMVHRKWRNQANHALTKAQGLVAYTGVLLFLGGSIWPMVTRREVLDEIWPNFLDGEEQLHWVLFAVLITASVICGLFSMALLVISTPSRHSMAAGVRRARKLGRGGVGLNWDSASSLPIALALMILTFASGWLFFRASERGGHVIAGLPPLWTTLEPLVLFGVMVLFIQGVLERFSSRLSYILLFLLWAPPLFAGVIIAAAFEMETVGRYMMLPCPPVSIVMSLLNFLEQADLGALELEGSNEEINKAAMTMTAVVGYSLGAIAIQAERFRWARRVKLAA